MEATTMSRMIRPDCLAGLARKRVGRVAVTDRAMPVVIPVNYALVTDAIIFRTRADGLLARACDGNVVAFEVDELSEDGSHGWSILVVGMATLLTGSAATRAASLGLTSAMGEGRDQFVTVTLHRVSGRRVGASAAEQLRGTA